MLRKSVDWYYWLATAALLAVGLLSWRGMLAAVIALGVVQLVHFRLATRSSAAFPVQVRAAYLGLLLLGCWPPLGFIHWIQLVGTWAMVLAGYCLLARAMSLLPWNRREPLTGGLVLRTFASPPCKGSILQGLPAAPDAGR